jgi:3-oxoacyl-[acyl-carrier-protein] synthase II
MRRRVLITGLGPVCSVGTGVGAFWEGLCAGRSALGPIGAFDASALGPKLAGEVPGLNVRDLVPKSYRKATKVMARDIELAVAAARLAGQDAGLVTRGSDEGAEGFAVRGDRTGCHIGAGLISADPAELGRAIASSLDDDGSFSLRKWGTENPDAGAAGAMNNLPPLWLLKYLPNMLACHVTIIHGCEGPSNTIMGAEAGALQSVGESTRVIERGDAEVCFTGGAESRVNPMGVVRMQMAGRLAETDASVTDGAGVVRPYDASSGGVLGEAGGMLIVEEAGHAEARGARAYAEVAGFGSGMDVRPITPGLRGEGNPDEDRGLTRAIRWAIRDAGIGAQDIDAVVPMAAGQPELDRREWGALRAALGDAAGRPMITLTPNAGNTLAGHGGLMVAAGAMALHAQRLPARVHAGRPEGADAGAWAGGEPGSGGLRHVLVCAGSFGGQAAAVVLRRVG